MRQVESSDSLSNDLGQSVDGRRKLYICVEWFPAGFREGVGSARPFSQSQSSISGWLLMSSVLQRGAEIDGQDTGLIRGLVHHTDGKSPCRKAYVSRENYQLSGHANMFSFTKRTILPCITRHLQRLSAFTIKSCGNPP